MRIVGFLIIIILSIPLYSQRILEYNGDTLIAITPKNLATINSIITERKYLEKEVEILSKTVELQKATIIDQREIIKTEAESKSILEEKHSLKIKEQAYKWRKKTIRWSCISASIGLVMGIIITN
jgi:hypothetical protein